MHDPYGGRLYTMFRAAGDWCVTWRKTTIAITALAFVASMAPFRPGAEAVLPDRQPARADRRPAAGAGRLLGRDRRRGATLEKWLGENPDVAFYTSYVGAGSAALLPADRARARQRQFRPGHRHDQGPRRARARASPTSSQLFDDDFEAVRGRVQRAAERPAGRLSGDVPRAGRRSAAGARRGRAGPPGVQGRSGHARHQFRLERARQDGAARGRPEQGARARRRFAAPRQHAADAAVGRDRDAVPRAHRDDRRGGPRGGARAAQRRGPGGDQPAHRQRRRGLARPARDAATSSSRSRSCGGATRSC